jgi:hypothetical protein
MKRDDGEDAKGSDGGRGNQQWREVGADCRNCLTGGLPQFGVASPGAQQKNAANHESRERHGNKQQPEADVRLSGIPVDNSLCSVGRLELHWLDLARKERGHKQDGREDKEQLRRGCSAVNRLHNHFVLQSEWAVNKYFPRASELLSEH